MWNHIQISPFFFVGGQHLNSEPCIYYVLSILTELSSREHLFIVNIIEVVEKIKKYKLEKNVTSTLKHD